MQYSVRAAVRADPGCLHTAALFLDQKPWLYFLLKVLPSMADARRRVLSEGMLSERAAHYVCYPGDTAASRTITVKANAYNIVAVCLRLCRERESDDKKLVFFCKQHASEHELHCALGGRWRKAWQNLLAHVVRKHPSQQHRRW